MHIYECPDGSKVPSVTTILSILGNKEIIKWANNLGFHHINYEKKLETLANDGTKMHTILQHIVDDTIEDEQIIFKDKLEENKYSLLADRFRNMIKRYDYKTIFTEKSFVSSKLGYGGTIDWFANMSGLYMINDFKSSKKVYIKHLLQIGGYYNLLVENGYKVDGGSIILVNEKIASLFPVGEESLKYLGDIFNHIACAYSKMHYNDTSESINYDASILEKIKH